MTEVQGIKFRSVFNTLQNFNVCSPGMPPCLGHDIFEGVLSYDVALYLKILHPQKEMVHVHKFEQTHQTVQIHSSRYLFQTLCGQS